MLNILNHNLMLPKGQWLPLQSLLTETIKLVLVEIGSKLTLNDHVSRVFYCGSVGLCARHQAYVTDIVALTAVI